MGNDLLASLRQLSDTELVARVRDLAARERGVMVVLVAHLAELDTRDVHLRAGHGSLFAYCRDVLGLSEQEAYNRIAVARAVRRFPVILEMLEAGAVNLTSVRLLAPHLTADNHRSVLESARGRTKIQVEEIAAALWPRPDAPSFVRKLPAAMAFVAAPVAEKAGALPDHAPSHAEPPVAALAATTGHSAKWSAEVTPLAPDRYKVQVTIGGGTLEKLRLAKDLLRHAVPSGDEAAILDRALTALLADLAQKKFAASEKPRPSGGATPGSRHVPAEVKRTVWLRDMGRCAFVGTTGRRCAERAFLEFHHVKPYALGGETTAANIQLRCRNHNGYEARQYFGRVNGDGGMGSVRETLTPYGLRCPEAGSIRSQPSGTRSRTSPLSDERHQRRAGVRTTR
jgi:hypothetical protein